MHIPVNYIQSFLLSFLILLSTSLLGQGEWEVLIDQNLPAILKKHRALVSLPNISSNEADMYKNVDWVRQEFEQLDFDVSLLESSTLPVFLAEKQVDEHLKTILFYLHLDGQDVDPSKWQQEDPFIPVLKERNEQGEWDIINWDKIDGPIDPEWRVFGRAAADDKAPIIMLLSALSFLKEQEVSQKYNIKIILDLQEEAGSDGFLSTLELYKTRYAADYLIIMDGPAHPSNEPTLTFGCRGIATCSIRTYGAALPQHSGHYGNYAPNPVFTMAHLLASMKSPDGRVAIDGYYDNIEITPAVDEILKLVPDDNERIRTNLGIAKADNVGQSYQEALQYPSFNVRQIETSWKGENLKTVIPEFATAHIDVRLVMETDGAEQLDKIRMHIENQGFLILDRVPNMEERLNNRKIVTFLSNPGINAFRTELDSPFAGVLRTVLEKEFNKAPVLIRTMGGTVPIIPAINTLDIPAIIIPMVNMDNNQHSPNENIRIGNISQGIRICLAVLTMDVK